MDIFISWSGPRSGALAEALRTWLPKIVNAFKPWLSSADIDKGARWSSDVAVKLAEAKAGIICVTPSNLRSPWILFEAGALSKTLESTFVCPLLLGLEPSDVDGPLAQFQATRTTKADFLKLLKTLNLALRESALSEAHIEDAFEVWWPRLSSQLEALPPDGPTARPRRTDRDLIEELVDLVRNQSRVSGNLSSALRWTERQEAFAFEVIDALKALRKPAAEGLKIDTPYFRYSGKNLDGEDFTITVPGDTPIAAIGACVSSQITIPDGNDRPGRPPQRKKKAKDAASN